MDLVIESLTGTVFELRVSPFETIMSVKAKIQRLEGIPMSQQHLIWQSVELEDDYCLHDYNIQDGTTLKLVLAMRGGPINTRRVSLEDPTLREMAEYMEANRDDIWDLLMKDNRHVTLLVFRDGDQVNFFRVYDRGDGTLTPMSGTLSATSMYNMYEEGDEVPDTSSEKEKETVERQGKLEVLREEMAKLSVKRKERERENFTTKAKMDLLRTQMAQLNISKKPTLKPRPPSSDKPNSNLNKRRLKFAEHVANQRQKGETGTKEGTIPQANHIQCQETAKKSLPPVSLHRKITNDIDISDIMAANNRDSKIIQDLSGPVQRPLELNRQEATGVRLDQKDRVRRRTNSTRKLPRRGNHSVKNVIGMSNSGHVRHEGFLNGDDELDSTQNNRSNDSRFGNNSSSSRIIKDLMLRNSSMEESDLKDFNRSYVDEIPFSPDEREEGRSVGHLPRGSKEYRDYKALISWIRPRTEAREHSPIRENSRVRFDTENSENNPGKSAQINNSLTRSKQTPEELLATMALPPRTPTSKRMTTGRDSSTYVLPPVPGKKRPPQLLASRRKKSRCTQCAKKLGLATSYQCRCGNMFCATHRYAETHDCSFDYKAEGKKVLEQSNPLVVAPKLPKI